MIRIILLLVLLGTPAGAQTAMTGDEFDAYTIGKTLTFMENGQAYGIEQYLPGRRVTWAFDNGACQKGRWFEAEPTTICFIYDKIPNQSQCWKFFKSETGILARFIGETGGRELYEARRSRLPLLCLGPEVGV